MPDRCERLPFARLAKHLPLFEKVGKGTRAPRFSRLERLFGAIRLDEQLREIFKDVLAVIDERDSARIAGDVGSQVVDDSRAGSEIGDGIAGLPARDFCPSQRAARAPFQLQPSRLLRQRRGALRQIERSVRVAFTEREI